MPADANIKKRRSNNERAKTNLLYRISAIVFVILLAGTFSAYWLIRSTDHQMRKDLLRQVKLAANALDARAISAFTATQLDLKSDEFILIKKQLIAIRSANPDCVYMYLARKNQNGDVVFLLDIGHTDDPLEENAQPGDLYDDAPAEFADVMRTAIPGTIGPYTDKWGTFISGLVPVINPHTGSVIALLGMDIDASTWRKKILQQALPAAALVIISFILLALSIVARVRGQGEKRARLQKSAIATLAFDNALKDQNINKAIESITKVIAESIQADRVSIWRFSEDKSNLHCITLYNLRTKQFENELPLKTQDFPFYLETLRNEKRLFVNDIRKSSATRELLEIYFKPRKIKSIIESGIIVSGDFVGLLSIEMTAHRRSWYADEEVFVNTCATIVAQVFTDYDRMLAQQAFMQSEKKYRLFFDQSPLGVVLFDERGDITECNQSFIRMTNTNREDLLQKNLFDISNAQIIAVLHKTLEGRAGSYEGLCNFFDSFLLVPVRVIFSPILNITREIQGGISVWEDRSAITEKEVLEKQYAVASESARFKQNFLANMSHELRTPLTGILGMLEVMQHTPLNASQQEYLAILRSSGENLREIINQVLDFSKIEAGKTKLRNRNFKPALLLEKTWMLFSPSCQSKEIAFSWHIDPMIPETLVADSQRIAQITNNLVSNAVKFTDRGSIELKANLMEKSQVKNSVKIKIEIKDTGRGIAPDKQNMLFIPFSQTHEHDIRSHEGTGLGLSISKELTRLLGGEMGVKSQEGIGSTFWFTFMAIMPSLNSTPLKQNDTSYEVPENLSILVAEDKPINQKVIQLILTSHGHHVTLAANGKQAIEAFQPGKFNLILMDIQMPEVDGIEATKILRERHVNLPPVVGLSANAFEGDKEKYIALGLDGYLTKPLDYQEFIHTISMLLSADSPDQTMQSTPLE